MVVMTNLAEIQAMIPNSSLVNISEDGRYFSGYDGKVHEDGGHPFFVDDWLWDTYRGLHPLMLILNPAQQVTQQWLDGKIADAQTVCVEHEHGCHSHG